MTPNSTDHAAWPAGWDNGKRLTSTVFLPQIPCERFALMIGPTGGGLKTRYHGRRGCRNHHLPKCRTSRKAWKGSVCSLIALNWVTRDPNPMTVAARESQLATVDEVSIARVVVNLNRKEIDSWLFESLA